MKTKTNAVLVISVYLSLLGAELRAQQIDLGSAASNSAQKASNGQNVGWGAGIEVSRNAHAAESALQRGNAAAAVDSAERAANAAPQNLRLWFLLGYAARLAGQFAKSESAYQHGLKLDHKNLDGLSGLAQTYQRMGRVDEARRLLLQVIAAAPNRTNDLLIAGELAMQSGDTQQGINLLSRAEAAQPSARAEVMLSMAYVRANQPEQARRMLAQARRREPSNPAVFRAVANLYREQHEYQSAIDVLKSAPVKNSEVLADLAYSYELNGDQKEASATYSRAADLVPGQANLQLSAAQAALRADENAQARAYLSRAAQLAPEHYRLHALRAQLARNENRLADAIAEYLTALSRLPSGAVPEGHLYPVELRLNLAELYRQTGKLDDAQQQLALAEAEVSHLRIEGPARAEFLRVRASVLAGAGDLAGAEKDLKEAMQLDPRSPVTRLQYASLLWRAHRDREARQLYAEVLSGDIKNRDALLALGYIAREQNDTVAADRYFHQLAEFHPEDYVPYLALGDLYAAREDFSRANDTYQQAFQRAPLNAVIIANAVSAAIQAGKFDLASTWVERAGGSLQNDPLIMRERERVLFHAGKYAEAARLGYRVLAQVENDRNASVYLAYALYNLGRTDEALALAERYTKLLPREADFPLMAGHVHKQNQLLQQAVQDYTEAIHRNPSMVEGYVNRGYVLNDLQNPDAAIEDFHAALRLQSSNGVAHLGLAFSELQLHHGRAALDEVSEAEKLLGESGATHLARASAYRELRLLSKAEQEYEAALRAAPEDLKLHLALADTEFHSHRYAAEIETLNAALSLSPDDPEIYSLLAEAHAELHHHGEAARYVGAAEKLAPTSAVVLLNTGNALLTMGEERAASERFSRALEAPDSNRVAARLLFAKVFVRQHKFGAAQQQIGLAFAESRVGEASPVTADDFIEAANLFLAMNDFDLARKYFDRARQAGAAEEVAAIGEVNSAIAEGRTTEAQRELAQLGGPAQFSDNFDYAMAQANIYRQQHQPFRAMTAFARANQLGGEDDTAEFAMQQSAAEQGMQVSRSVSVASDVLVHRIIDDATILGLDRQIFHNAQGGAIPPPRSSLETLWTNGYRADLGSFPALSGFVQVRNARGELSLPSELLIVSRDTWDYNFNSALNPVLRLGRATFSFNTGLQVTVRRDREDPYDLNQNLFRQFAYMSSNAIGNWLTVQGEAYHEAGPFNDQNLHSRELGAQLQFIVGRPWGRTQFITSYGTRDLLFRPLIREFYETTTSAGVQHEFGERLRVAVLGQYIRSWRVQDLNYWIAQAFVPSGEVEWKPNHRWAITGDFAYSYGQGIHDYDNVQSSVLISYIKPLTRKVSDGYGPVPVEYPIRFSLGVVNANYMNFSGNHRTILSPEIRLTLF